MVSTAVKPWNSAPQENGWKSVVQSSVSCKEIPAQLPQHWSLKAHWLQNLTQELLKVEEITTAVWTEKAEFCTSICIHGRIYRILIYWYEFYQFWSFLGWHCLGAFLNYHLFWFGFVTFFLDHRERKLLIVVWGWKTEQPLASAQQSLPPQLVEQQMANAQLFLPQPPPVPGKAEQGKRKPFRQANHLPCAAAA